MSRTDLALAIFVGIGLSLLVVQMSGLASILGVNDTGEYQVDDRVKSEAGQDNKPSVEGDVVGGNTPSQLQFIVGALQTFVGWATGVFLLPATFNQWLPWYTAYPFGLGLQGLAIWGVAQVAGGAWR